MSFPNNGLLRRRRDLKLKDIKERLDFLQFIIVPEFRSFCETKFPHHAQCATHIIEYVNLANQIVTNIVHLDGALPLHPTNSASMLADFSDPPEDPSIQDELDRLHSILQ